MQKTSALRLMFAVWGSGLLSAAALAFVLTRPLGVTPLVESPSVRVDEARVASPAPAAAMPIVMPALTIRATPVVIAVRRTIVQKPREIVCTEFRDLAQGPTGAKVRVCE